MVSFFNCLTPKVNALETCVRGSANGGWGGRGESEQAKPKQPHISLARDGQRLGNLSPQAGMAGTPAHAPHASAAAADHGLEKRTGSQRVWDWVLRSLFLSFPRSLVQWPHDHLSKPVSTFTGRLATRTRAQVLLAYLPAVGTAGPEKCLRKERTIPLRHLFLRADAACQGCLRSFSL